MAIELADLPVLAQLRKRFPDGSRLAILGDCAFHFDNATLGEHFGVHAGGEERASLKSFAVALGFATAHTFDIHGTPTHLLNLEVPLPAILSRSYDWVIDAGTLFWCFDPAAVLRNVTTMLADDGCVMHVSALTGYFGRGYYSIQPRLFRDFYTRNGFEIVAMATRPRPGSVRSGVFSLRRLLAKAPKGAGWKMMAADAIHLSGASATSLNFTTTQGRDPRLVPNNAVVMCFAHRLVASPFVPAAPLGANQ